MRRTLFSLLGLSLGCVATVLIARAYADCSSTTPNLGLANCTIGTARSIVDPAWLNNFLLLDLGFTSPLSISGVGSASPTVSLSTVPETKGGTNQTTYTTGDTLYASGANTLAKLSGNTTTIRKFRQQHGNGTAVTSESWDLVTEPDLPATRITAATQFSNSLCSDDQVILKSGGAWVCGSTIGSGDITDVWTCTSGNCNAITGASGDSLNASGADSSIPWKTGTTAPGTCSVGMAFFDTDATAGQNVYGCTATNTWTLEGGAGSGDITDVWACTSGNCNALTAASGDTLDAKNADSTAPNKSGTTAPGTCSVGQTFFDTDATAGSNIYGCTATNTWTLESGGGGSGDITDVWSCTSGDCNALTAASGDTFNATSADSTAPNKSGTSPPGTCSVGMTFFDTAATAGNNIYGCTSTNTWTLEGDGGGGSGDITDVWSCTTGNCNALTAASGDTLNAKSADSTAPNKSGTSPPGTCAVGDTFFDTDATAGNNIYGCTATNTWTLEGDGGGAGAGDITDVWNTTSGNVNALVAASGDSLDAGSADSTIACKKGTSLPGTCTVGECYFKTDATAGSNLYGCTATNTWTVEGGSGGGTPYASKWDPDAKPASSDSHDDEFDDSSYDTGKWTTWNYGSNTTVTEDAAGLLLTHTNTNGHGGAYQALPSGDFTIFTRIDLLSHSLDHGAGIALYEDATSSSGDIFYCWIDRDTTATVQEFTSRYNAYNSFNTHYVSHQLTAAVLQDTNRYYLRLRRSGTGLSCDVSVDGLNWDNYDSARTQPFTPTHFGPAGALNSGSGTAYERFAFFRYVPSDIGITGLSNGRRIGLFPPS